MLLSSWPEAGARLLRVLLDGWECAAVRAAAARFLVAAAAVAPATLLGAGTAAAAAAAEAGLDGEPQPQTAAAAHQLHRLGLAALLQQQQLWEELPGVLTDPDTPPALAAAAAALALLAVVADPEGAGQQLLSCRGVVGALLRLAVPAVGAQGPGQTALLPGCDAHLQRLLQLRCRCVERVLCVVGGRAWRSTK